MWALRCSPLLCRERVFLCRAAQKVQKKKETAARVLPSFEQLVQAWERFSKQKIDVSLPWLEGYEPDWLQMIDKAPLRKDKVPDLTTEAGRKLAAKQKRHKAIKTRNRAYGDQTLRGWRLVQEYERKRANRLKSAKARRVKHYSSLYGDD
jgi:hypothetical protein